jgi:hypothetical protein
MLTAHILMMLIPGILTPISTEQVFESKASCEIAREALASTDSVNRYLCTPVPNTTPNR